jgi:diphthamide biosynthesis protein 7
LHFIPGRQTFAVASSVGTISFYNFQTHDPSSESPANIRFHHIATHQVFSTSELVLSITWIPKDPPLLLATLNTGEIYLIHFPTPDFTTYTLLNDELPLSTHGAEAWISAVCPTLQHIYTGGDDAELRIHDINLQEVPTNDLSITLSSKPRGHDAGVTAILPLSSPENRMFLTGSYDDHIRLYAILPNGYAKLLTEKYLGGGVWRLKLVDEERLQEKSNFRLLASCMHAGSKILEVSYHGEEWNIEEVAWNKEHKSMNYASDAQSMVDGDENSKRICVSSSFYDKLLVVWEFDPLVKTTS